MRKIKTSTGAYTLVDDEDYDMLNSYKWHISGKGYVISRPVIAKGKKGIIWMHRLVNKTPQGLITDHINHNKLDNRRKNLRTVTDAINMQNRSNNRNNTTGYRGVLLEPSGKYRARIHHNKRPITIGMFNSPRAAYLAYRKKAKELWGSPC